MREPARTLRTDDPPPALVERSNWPTTFSVPVEMVLQCTSSAIKTVIEKRRANGDFVHPVAELILRHGRFYATVYFGPGRVDLFLPLDVWAWENKSAGGGA